MINNKTVYIYFLEMEAGNGLAAGIVHLKINVFSAVGKKKNLQITFKYKSKNLFISVCISIRPGCHMF